MPRCFVSLTLLALFVFGCSDTTVSTPGTTTTVSTDGTGGGSALTRICAEAVALDGTYVPAVITHNDVPFSGDCVSADPSAEHVIRTEKAVGDLNCPNHTVTIAANELRGGEERNVRFLYKAADMRLLTVVTVSPLGKPVDGQIEFDGHEFGIGEATVEYDPSAIHRVSFGDIEYLVTPDDVVMELEQYADGFVMEAVYDFAENAAEVCFYPRNAETGEIINAIVQVNGMELDENEYCRFLNTTNIVRASSEYRNGLNTPQQFKIPPHTLQPESSYEYDLVYDTDTLRLCVDTVPVLGEVFITDIYGAQRSIGWPLDDEYACVNVNPDTFARVEFGEVDGFETAEAVDALTVDDWQYKTVYGLYDHSDLALVCVFHEAGTGGGWIYITEVTMDDQVFKHQEYRQWACLAADPTVEHTITWGPPEDGYASYTPPTPVVIPANTLLAGEQYDYVGEYVRDYSTSGGYRTVRVQILNDFGEPQRAHHDVSFSSYLHEGPETQWYGDADSVIEFVFYDEAYLLTPDPLVIDVATLAGDDGNYNADEELWEFEVVYHSAEPSAWVCTQALNHEGALIEPDVEFDALRPANYSDPLERCRVLPVGMDHQIYFFWQSGYHHPAPLYIPSGRLAAGSRKTYTTEYVLENRHAILQIGTDGAQGEIFLNGRSLGWTAVLGVPQIWAPVDITRENTVSFGVVGGFTLPASFVFLADTLPYASTSTAVGVYQ